MSPAAVSFVLVCGIGALNSLMLAVYLLHRGKGLATPNGLLAALVLTFSVRTIKAVVVFFVSGLHPFYEFAWVAVLGMTGPCALAYLLRLRGPGPGDRRLIVATVAAAALTATLVFLALPLHIVWKLMAAALAVYGCTLVAMLPHVFRQAEPQEPASRLATRWVRGLVAFLTGIWALHATLIVRRLLAGRVLEDRYFQVEAVAFSLAIYALLYSELRYGFITGVHRDRPAGRVVADDPMLRRVRQAVEVERMFLEPSLSLSSLAASLRLSPQHLSRLINAGIGVSFNDYVNRLRVQEAMRLLSLPDGPSRKIGVLGFDCGFNSASVFYAAFKKFAGRTPSEYLREVNRT